MPHRAAGQGGAGRRTVTVGQYRVIKKIGSGAFSDVYSAEDGSCADRGKVALKKLNISNRNEVAEAKKEVAAMQRVAHFHIVRCHQHFMHDGWLCIVMDLADGGDLYGMVLSQKLRMRQTRSPAYFPEKSVLSWFIQLACGLKHCHDHKLLHRDIKSKNILLFQNSRFPGGFVLKLGDFGLARSVRTDQGNLARTTVGTPLNMSPELMQNLHYSFETDVWALGTVLYEVCALQPPFVADTMKELRKVVIRTVPAEIPTPFSRTMRRLISNMLQKQRIGRPSIDDVLKLPYIRQSLTDNLDAQRQVRYCLVVLPATCWLSLPAAHSFVSDCCYAVCVTSCASAAGSCAASART
jgi:NIMA (never in mitosis gene a)-related kinase